MSRPVKKARVNPPQQQQQQQLEHIATLPVHEQLLAIVRMTLARAIQKVISEHIVQGATLTTLRDTLQIVDWSAQDVSRAASKPSYLNTSHVLQSSVLHNTLHNSPASNRTEYYYGFATAFMPERYGPRAHLSPHSLADTTKRSVFTVLQLLDRCALDYRTQSFVDIVDALSVAAQRKFMVPGYRPRLSMVSPSVVHSVTHRTAAGTRPSRLAVKEGVVLSQAECVIVEFLKREWSAYRMELIQRGLYTLTRGFIEDELMVVKWCDLTTTRSWRAAEDRGLINELTLRNVSWPHLGIACHERGDLIHSGKIESLLAEYESTLREAVRTDPASYHTLADGVCALLEPAYRTARSEFYPKLIVHRLWNDCDALNTYVHRVTATAPNTVNAHTYLMTCGAWNPRAIVSVMRAFFIEKLRTPLSKAELACVTAFPADLDKVRSTASSSVDDDGDGEKEIESARNEARRDVADTAAIYEPTFVRHSTTEGEEKEEEEKRHEVSELPPVFSTSDLAKWLTHTPSDFTDEFARASNVTTEQYERLVERFYHHFLHLYLEACLPEWNDRLKRAHSHVDEVLSATRHDGMPEQHLLNIVQWSDLLRFSLENFTYVPDTTSIDALTSAVIEHLNLTKKRLRNAFFGIMQRLVKRLSPVEERGVFVPYGKEHSTSEYAVETAVFERLLDKELAQLESRITLWHDAIRVLIEREYQRTCNAERADCFKAAVRAFEKVRNHMKELTRVDDTVHEDVRAPSPDPDAIERVLRTLEKDLNLVRAYETLKLDIKCWSGVIGVLKGGCLQVRRAYTVYKAIGLRTEAMGDSDTDDGDAKSAARRDFGLDVDKAIAGAMMRVSAVAVERQLTLKQMMEIALDCARRMGLLSNLMDAVDTQ